MRNKSSEEQVSKLQKKYQAMKPYLNERSRRIWAASEARSLGFGGQEVGTGKPLVDTATIVRLIGNTTTKKGLTIKARLDGNIYEKSIKVTDEEFRKIALERNPFHGDWNYKITPQIT